MTRMEQAVVVGGSVAGLAAAGVLAARFGRVTVIDARQVPDGVASIAPQGQAPHLLLDGGRQALEAIFPRLSNDLFARGALAWSARDLRLWFHGYRARPAGAPTAPLCSRALLETTLRARVLALPNVDWRTGRVEDLRIAGRQVRGVTLGDGDALAADLVVDCAGRGSGADAWLAAAGFPAARIESVGVGIRYRAMEIARRPGDADGDLAMFIQNTPPAGKRFGLAFAVEGERWKVLLGGYFGDAPPEDDAGFAAFAHSLGAPDIARLIAGRERQGPFFRYAFPASVRRRPGPPGPEGFVRLGDSVASFNPVYGQGMSSAALQAASLAANLDRHGLSPRLAPAQARDAARIVDGAWQLSTGGDFGYAETQGRRPAIHGLTSAYAARVMAASIRDAAVAAAVGRVVNQLQPPARLMTPSLLWRALTARRAPERQTMPLTAPQSRRKGKILAVAADPQRR